MAPKPDPQCALCRMDSRACISKEGKGPSFCPTLHRAEDAERALKKYQDPETKDFAKAASLQEAECYAERDAQHHVLKPTKTRVEEIIEFSKRMGYKRIGVAFCGGLFSEAHTFARILEKNGLEPVSVCCKVGGVPKEFLGLEDKDKIRIGAYETMCNPIAQAEVLNEAQTDFNVLIGLCVGHDSLFFKHAKALTTVLVTKDRVLGHNPVAALYGVKVYFQRLLKP
ncbi:MAG: DUF1847 domain-containing protein [Syntrophaceae bacterium]|nr:DUF1847 domain-containing protein [Syntrophaceae bacterium]